MKKLYLAERRFFIGGRGKLTDEWCGLLVEPVFKGGETVATDIDLVVVGMKKADFEFAT